MGEFDVMFLAVAPDPQLQLARQRVDDGDADAVQAAGNLVGVLVELSAGVSWVMMTSAAEMPSPLWMSTECRGRRRAPSPSRRR